MNIQRAFLISASVLIAGTLADRLVAQSVCLPAPRLLTTMPMGGQAGQNYTTTTVLTTSIIPLQ